MLHSIFKTSRILPVLFVPLIALSLGAAPWDDDDDDEDEIELEEAEVFIEFNFTDGDIGIQFFWDGEAWKKMSIKGPHGRTVLRVKSSGYLADQGLAEGFFESNEPSLDELSMEVFFERFPAGEYEFEGRTVDGDEIEGETEFTHVLPAPPSNLWPADGDDVDHWAPLVVTFDAVTQDLDGQPLTPVLYEVIVETEGDILRVLSLILDGGVAHPAVTIPPEFLTPETEYKLEIIVQEESGNKTIAETEFSTL